MDRRSCLIYYIPMSNTGRKNNLEGFDPDFKSREVKNEYGEDIDEGPIQKSEFSRMNSEVRREDLKHTPELSASLEKVDFELFRTIISDRLRKMGIDPKTINFLGPNRIFDSSNFGGRFPLTIGNYDVVKNVILINHKKITEEGAAGPNNTEDDRDLLVASAVMHEQTHAVSKSLCRGMHFEAADMFYPAPKDTVRVGVKVGYLHVLSDFESRPGDSTFDVLRREPYVSAQFFGALNEAVTEKFAREMFVDYLQKDPDMVDPAMVSKWREFYINHPEQLSYGLEVDVLEALIERISRETGVSEDVVWQAMAMGMFKGESLFDQEIAQAFEEIFGREFLIELSSHRNLNGESYVSLIRQIYSDRSVNDLIRKVVKRLHIEDESKVA